MGAKPLFVKRRRGRARHGAPVLGLLAGLALVLGGVAAAQPNATGTAARPSEPGVPQAVPPDAPADQPGAKTFPLLTLPPGAAPTPAPDTSEPPLPRSADAVPVPAEHQAGSAPGGVLEACWTSEQLAGTPEERAIRRLKTDPAPPPEWAVRAAETALPPLAPGLRGSIRAVEPRDPQARLVALTFDLCEQSGERAGYDGAVVDALRRLGVKATFFAGGQWLRSHPERAMQLMADGNFEVGNHAWTHANLRLVEGASARDQIVWTQAQYQVLRRELAERSCARTAGPAAMARVPEWPRVFRFPYGTCNAGALGLTAELGLPAIQWNLVTGDPDQGRGAHAIAAAVLAGVRKSRGTIVVAHANGRGWHTAEALPLFVPTLQREGYRFVTLSELLAAGEPVAAEECYEVHPGDNRRYDTLSKGAGRK